MMGFNKSDAPNPGMTPQLGMQVAIPYQGANIE